MSMGQASRRRRPAARAGALACCLGLAAASPAAALTVTVHDISTATTPACVGGNEGGVFRTNDLVDCGINLYRIWTTLGELEWADDDWRAAGTPGWPTYPTSTYYGVPSIEEIKTNVGVIPWQVWEDAFTNSRWTAAVPFREVLDGCRAAGVTPLLVLRPKGPSPGEDWIPWIPNAPDGAAYWQEWWEYCFAVACWCNVSNGYGITHFEIHNEPDLASQGWSGTQSQYVQLVNYARDALQFANSISGLPVVLHAPVVANYNSSYIAYALDNADTNIDVVGYHVYDKYHSLTTSIRAVMQAVTNHNPDGNVEPVWISEWGDLDGNYDTLSRGLLTAEQLYRMAEAGVGGSAIFMWYDWGARGGLISTGFVPRESYYAFRLMTRALGSGRDLLESDSDDASKMVMATRCSTGTYVVAVRLGTNVSVDLSAVGYLSATAEVRKYSAGWHDAVTGSVPVAYGRLCLACSTQEVLSAFLSSGQVDDGDRDGMADAWELAFFPTLTNANATSDGDGDRFIDRHEYLAGTIPTDSLSFLQVEEVSCPGPEAVALRWPSESNRAYAIDHATDPGQVFSSLTSGIPATWPVNVHTDGIAGVARRFYRVRLETE